MPRVALGGYCPVELSRHGRWAPGDLRWTVVYKGWIYRLSGAEQRQQFLADPDSFAPVNSCNDPVLSVDEHRTVAGQTAYCAVYDGRLYMFSSAATQAQFNRNPQRYAGRTDEGRGRRVRERECMRCPHSHLLSSPSPSRRSS